MPVKAPAWAWALTPFSRQACQMPEIIQTSRNSLVRGNRCGSNAYVATKGLSRDVGVAPTTIPTALTNNIRMNTKSILLNVTGLTPQVVTETLYALHQQGQVLPEQIHILTTAEGYQRARLTLINDGWLARFYNDYQLPKPDFSERHIHILATSQWRALSRHSHASR